MKFSKYFLSLLIGLSSLLPLAYAEQATGLIDLTPEQEQAFRETHREIREVRRNERALKRLKREKLREDRRKARELRRASRGFLETVFGGTQEPDVTDADLDAISDVEIVGATLRAVDNSELPSFPQVRNQGSIGSCVSWALVYYQLTHEVGLLRGYDSRTNPQTQLSPKYLYCFTNSGENVGTDFSTAYSVLLKHGAPSWQSWPYNSDFRAWPTNGSIWEEAYNNLPQAVEYLSLYQHSAAQDISVMKGVLANGHLIVYSTYINSWQFKTIKDNLTTDNDNVAIGKQIATSMEGQNGSHAMTLVGYNDDVWVDINNNNIMEAEEVGAFKIVNSWGTGWKNGGFAWVAYDALYRTSKVSNVTPSDNRRPIFNSTMYKLNINSSSIPKVLFQFTTKHRSRDRILMKLGVSNPTGTTPTTVYQPMVFSWPTGGPYAYDGKTTAINGTFTVDFTPLVSDTNSSRRYWIWFEDAPPYPLVPNNYDFTYLTSKLIDKTKNQEAILADSTFTLDNSGKYISIVYPGNNIPLPNRPPTATLIAVPNTGVVPLFVRFTVDASDPDGNSLTYQWDFGTIKP